MENIRDALIILALMGIMVAVGFVISSVVIGQIDSRIQVLDAKIELLTEVTRERHRISESKLNDLVMYYKNHHDYAVKQGFSTIDKDDFE